MLGPVQGRLRGRGERRAAARAALREQAPRPGGDAPLSGRPGDALLADVPVHAQRQHELLDAHRADHAADRADVPADAQPAIRLRYTEPDTPRPYRVPGGRYVGMWVVAGMGILGSAFGLVIGFFPPSGIPHWPTPIYVGAMLVGDHHLLAAAVPGQHLQEAELEDRAPRPRPARRARHGPAAIAAGRLTAAVVNRTDRAALTEETPTFSRQHAIHQALSHEEVVNGAVGPVRRLLRRVRQPRGQRPRLHLRPEALDRYGRRRTSTRSSRASSPTTAPRRTTPTPGRST